MLNFVVKFLDHFFMFFISWSTLNVGSAILDFFIV